MKPGIGKLTAHLADLDEPLPADVVEQINRRIKPPEELTAQDVFVRAMYIVSDQVNSFGGRFPESEHEHLADLLVDTPVLVGHRKDRLPVARTFHAVMTEREGQAWVKSFFYWPRNADGAMNLKDNIDGGIVKECSISFTFHLPECSVCGRDIRLCEHEPMQKVSGTAGAELCHFNYRRVERVLETSLVYRGAVPGTGIEKPLEDSARSESARVKESPSLQVIDDLSRLKADATYLIVPHYDGLALSAERREDRLVLKRLEGSLLSAELCAEFAKIKLRPETVRPAHLVGYRGKERCTAPQLEQFLQDGSGPVTRLVLFVPPSSEESGPSEISQRSKFEVRDYPCRVAAPDQLDAAAAEIMTRAGVEIWSRPVSPESVRFLYQPRLLAPPQLPPEPLSLDAHTGIGRIRVQYGDRQATLRILSFDREKLRHGRTFLAELIDNSRHSDSPGGSGGEAASLQECGEGYRLIPASGADDMLAGRYLRPIRLGGKKRFLLCGKKLNSSCAEPERV